MQRITLKEKYNRPTRCNFGHTDILVNGNNIGYIMQNKSPFRIVGENWNFTSCKMSMKSLLASNRVALIKMIKLEAIKLY